MPKLTAIRKRALDEMMKEALFEATVAVLNNHGFEGMTMERVALAAGIAKGSVYNYFNSKKELLEFVYMKTLEPIFSNLVEVLATQESAIRKLDLHLCYLLEHIAKHAKVFKLLFDDDTAHGLLRSSERSTHEEVAQRFAEIFRQGITEGSFRTVDPLLLAHMFLGLTRGVFEGKTTLQEHSQRDNLRHLILNTFLNGIVTENGQ